MIKNITTNELIEDIIQIGNEIEGRDHDSGFVNLNQQTSNLNTKARIRIKELAKRGYNIKELSDKNEDLEYAMQFISIEKKPENSKITLFEKQEKQVIEFFKLNKDVRFTQYQLEKALFESHEEVINCRRIRSIISSINCNRTTKFFILTDGVKGYYVPEEMTEKLAVKEAEKLRKRALKELYRSSSMLKKFGIPFKNIFDEEVESFGV